MVGEVFVSPAIHGEFTSSLFVDAQDAQFHVKMNPLVQHILRCFFSPRSKIQGRWHGMATGCDLQYLDMGSPGNPNGNFNGDSLVDGMGFLQHVPFGEVNATCHNSEAPGLKSCPFAAPVD